MESTSTSTSSRQSAGAATGAPSTTNTNTTSNSNTSNKLSTAERKRLTDRKAQRQRRERIKSYIARLEKTLEDLTAVSGNGMEATLLKQLEQQRLKTERLTGVINHIQGVLEETRREGSLGVGVEGGSTSPLVLQDGLGDGDGALLGASGRLRLEREEVQRASDGNGNGNAHARQQSQAQSQAQSQSQQQQAPFTISADLSTRISLNSQNPRNSGTRNYFQVVNESISDVSEEQDAILPSTAAEDDDIAIRAILFGWDSIRSDGRRLDRVWGLLQALDQGIFSETGMVERVAVLRLMRSMIKWNISPREHTIPSFMFPTVTQSMVPHAPIIDFFAWPNLRDHLIVSGITNITETTAALYVSQIRLKWPYSLRDTCKLNVAENKYRFSSEFDAAYYDLQSWTIGSPQLQMLIENGPAAGMAGFDAASVVHLQGQGQGSEEGDGSYWDRLLDSCDQM
ncbi:bZIP transcription factor [Aspergillus stella-maris]|uniref:bZIP transcription factor n=1 Tax=Aspergillus stella-maris TaxID=1810926 RepID=UPI003CCE32CF